EPDDIGPEQVAAVPAARQVVEWLGATVLDLGALGAAHPRQVTVQFQDMGAAGRPVQTVHILGDEGEAVTRPGCAAGPGRLRASGEAPFKTSQGIVSRVGTDGAQVGTSGIVEAPDESGVAAECLGRGHFLDGMSLPEAAGAAEGGDAAFS